MSVERDEAHQADLLRSVIDDPRDEACRLRYAAHLEARGDAQGELIALHCRLAKLTGDDAGRRDLEVRANDLIARHAAKWNAALGADVTEVAYDLGLPFAAHVPLRAMAFDVLDRAPITELELMFDSYAVDTEDVPLGSSRTCDLVAATRLAADPRFARLARLATGTRLGPEALCALVCSPHASRLRSLSISSADARPYVGRALLEASLPALEVLVLCGDWRSGGGDEIAHDLAKARLPQLRDVVLRNLGCTEAAAVSLAHSATIHGLQALDLGSDREPANQIGPLGANALAASVNFIALRQLGLDGNAITDAGLVEIVRSAHLRELRSLSVRDNGLTNQALRVLATADLPHLESLDLSRNLALTPAGIAMLMESPRLETLRSLRLGSNLLGADAARVIGRSSSAAALRLLDLRDSQLADEGARALLESPHLENLTELDVCGNLISSDLRDAMKVRWREAVQTER